MCDTRHQEDILDFCEFLYGEHAIGNIRTIDDVISYFLGWSSEVIDPSEGVIHQPLTNRQKIAELRARLQATEMPYNDDCPEMQGTPGQIQGRAPSQAFHKACDGSRAEHSRAGQGALADSRPAARVRAVVEVTGQGGSLDRRPAAEVRALELLREGTSERTLLAILKQEGFRLNKNRLRSLREEAKATTT
jgi:hypothetical protein